ncbi:hypothetical protein, partial [Anaerotruncus massiliensis (ex Liu et al. 2021)]|uniref:hypothetical protein n=2 Tax=Anaerotruncus massiliensis (ex Liu et al. 2021) TaxID=2321404 RepID=UPI003AB4B313
QKAFSPVYKLGIIHYNVDNLQTGFPLENGRGHIEKKEFPSLPCKIVRPAAEGSFPPPFRDPAGWMGRMRGILGRIHKIPMDLLL